MYSLIPTATLLALLAQQPADEPRSDSPASAASARSAAPDVSPDWKPLGPSLWFDAQSKPKRLIIEARVVLRDGALEHLLCLKGTKEHEAIVATPADPKQIHAGLLLTGAEPGRPVRFQPKFEPPTGTPIDVRIRWKVDGKTREVDAREWIEDLETRKPLDIGWVFAGSTLYHDPTTNRTTYAALEGDLITVANFASSILDLPIASSASDANRIYIARTESLPPIGTKVQVILSPRKPAEPASKSKSPKPS